MGMRIGNSYHNLIYSPQHLLETTEKTIAKAREIFAKTPFDAFAFRGSSGAAMAFSLSITLQIPCIYIRKPGEQSHGNPIEGPNNEVKTYLIIDDFIERGATIRHILTSLARAQCVGALLYGRTTIDLSHKQAVLFGIPLWGAQ